VIKKTHVTHFQKNHGPGKLATVLKKGLSELGVELVSLEDAEHVACLQWMDEHLSVPDFDGKKALVGPNVWESPSERPYLTDRFSDFIVPSEWVKNKHLTDPTIEGPNVHVWAGGIETDIWKPTELKPDLDCFIYWKNRPVRECWGACEVVEEAGLNTIGIQYGTYYEHQLLELCHRSRFAILLTNTESQGFAYMQILSTGTPCLVLNQDIWISRDGTVTFPATSVPYFDNRCGDIISELDQESLGSFIDSLNAYSPRDYILENHTVEISTQKYLEILENVEL
jgi:hypothetical protein